MSREEAYLAGKGKDDPGIERWILIAPQLKAADKIWSLGSNELSVKYRSRVDDRGERFKVYSEPPHRAVAEVIAGVTRASSASPAIKRLSKSKTGVLVFYPVRGEKENFTSMGFALQLPPNGRPKELRYGALDDDDALT
jgi:hypothetical protein